MPSSPSRSETKDCDPIEEAPDDEANTGQENEVECECPRCHVYEAPSRSLPDHIRIVTLEAEVALLEQERTALEEQVAVLESNVEALEEETATLRDTVACKEQQLQQVIDRYEWIIREKDRVYQERVEEADPSSLTSGLSMIRKFIDNRSIG